MQVAAPADRSQTGRYGRSVPCLYLSELGTDANSGETYMET